MEKHIDNMHIYFMIIVIILELLGVYIRYIANDINNNISSIESSIDDQTVMNKVKAEIKNGTRNANGTIKVPEDTSELTDYWIDVENIEISEGYVYIYSNGLKYDTEFIPEFADPVSSYKLHIWINVGAPDKMPGCIDLIAYELVRIV